MNRSSTGPLGQFAHMLVKLVIWPRRCCYSTYQSVGLRYYARRSWPARQSTPVFAPTDNVVIGSEFCYFSYADRSSVTELRERKDLTAEVVRCGRSLNDLNPLRLIQHCSPMGVFTSGEEILHNWAAPNT